MLIRDKKYFEGFRWFALFTLLCTVVLWIALWGASATPGEISGAESWAMAGAIDDKYDLSQKFDSAITTQNVIVERTTGKAYYVGDQEQMKLTCHPSGTADTAVEWTSSNEDVATVDQNGLVTLVGKGEVRIYATLKSNKDIYNYDYFLCYGVNPENIDNPSIVINGNNKVTRGVTAGISLNGGKTSTLAVKFTTSDEDVAVVNSGYLVPKKAGKVTVTAKYTTGYEISCDVTVADNPNYLQATKIALNDVYINQGDVINIYGSIATEEIPKGASRRCNVTITQSKSIAGLRNDNLHVWGYGEFTLTFTSCYDENVTASITLYSHRKMPSDFRVSIPSVASPNNTYFLKAAHYPYPCTDEVKWEIVSGKHATLTENGVFVPKFFGTYVIRCTSTIDPSMSVEQTVEVKLFDNVHSFVRKLMGHMGLSGVLGFGLFFSYLFLSKRKWKCAVCPFVLSFVHGGLSEAIQYFTPGRMCTFADVLVDFMGGCIGIGVGIVLWGIIALLWWLINKDSFKRMIYAIKSLNLINSFKKMPKFDAEYAREEIKTQPKEDETQANAVA